MRKSVLLLLGAGSVAFLATRAWHGMPERFLSREVAPKPQPDAAEYRKLCTGLERQRLALAARYEQARTDPERSAVETEARAALETTLPKLMRCWLGTPWDFNGVATVPGEGRIACGYFVATILRDAGFRVERAKLAQQASQNILGTFLDRKSCRISAGQPYDSFASQVRNGERGISIVGLDSHVAFLVNEEDDFHMIHSSGASPWCVVDEPSAQASVLQRSSYRVVGHLTSDRGVLREWLSGKAIPVQVPKKRQAEIGLR